MILRNKKTGEIWKNAVIESYLSAEGYRLIVKVNKDASIGKHYDSLFALNEEWEDYKPAEPLIKDEKIRKAVRAWAEANEIEFLEVASDSRLKDCGGNYIEFLGLPFKELPKVPVYIAELCGEEEGC